jgi:hypothetical protein
MNTLNITLHDDGKVTRDDKHIATVDFETREIKWKHYTYRDKHTAEVVSLIKSRGDVEALVPDEVIEEIVEAVEGDLDKYLNNDGLNEDGLLEVTVKAEDIAPLVEPPKTSLGDRTPGYPEWILRTQGQEAYEARYHKYGKDRYTGKPLT